MELRRFGSAGHRSSVAIFGAAAFLGGEPGGGGRHDGTRPRRGHPRGGALETLVEAREAGLTRWLGISGPGVDAPAVFPRGPAAVPVRLGAVPLNFAQMGNPAYRRDAEALLARCRELDVGTIIIKSFTRGP